ncbi:MAG: ABC transporter permease [Melioribacteraceae bacterium]|jgi:ABC-2 type transport system permease protein|nr:ABC transporter permease [Melioribacteraceae bacterium]
MITLISIELQKIFRKWRTYIGFIAIGVLVVIVQVALYFTGEGYIKAITRNFQDSFIMVGNLFNGYLVANLVLTGLYIHIPFLIVLVGGDLLASEATSGTYRMLLTRPVSRFKVVSAKFSAGLIYVFLLLAWLAFLSLGVSCLIFGTGELVSFRGKLIIFSANDILWRFAGAYGYSMLSMFTVFAVSYFFSSMVENAIGPIVSTMAVIIIFLILSALPIDFLKDVSPYFFTSHMTQWDGFFHDPVDYTNIIESALVLGGHIVGLYLITSYIFLKKDILS